MTKGFLDDGMHQISVGDVVIAVLFRELGYDLEAIPLVSQPKTSYGSRLTRV